MKYHNMIVLNVGVSLFYLPCTDLKQNENYLSMKERPVGDHREWDRHSLEGEWSHEQHNMEILCMNSNHKQLTQNYRKGYGHSASQKKRL